MILVTVCSLFKIKNNFQERNTGKKIIKHYKIPPNNCIVSLLVQNSKLLAIVIYAVYRIYRIKLTVYVVITVRHNVPDPKQLKTKLSFFFFFVNLDNVHPRCPRRFKTGVVCSRMISDLKRDRFLSVSRPDTAKKQR